MRDMEELDPFAAFGPPTVAAPDTGIPVGPNGQPLTVQQTASNPDQWYTLADGTQVRETDLLPGETGYQSAPLVAGGTRTAQGTADNAFKGYVGPQGGTFGGTDPLMGRIARNDETAINEGLASTDPAVRRVAMAYALGAGSAGITDDDVANFDGLRQARQRVQQGMQAAGLTGMGGTYSLDDVRAEAKTPGGLWYTSGQWSSPTAQTGFKPPTPDVRPVTSATASPTLRHAGGQGFGFGYQNPYQSYRPVQGIGSPTLNKLATRPMSGGAY